MYLKKEDVTGLVIVLVMVLLIAAFFIFAPKAPEISYVPVEATGSALSVAEPDAEQLGEITVDAVVKTPGFITFHQAIGQAPGEVVGRSVFLEPGEYKDFIIKLAEPLEPVNQYFALMFKDDGDKVYRAGVDLPVMSEGAVIKVRFTTP